MPLPDSTSRSGPQCNADLGSHQNAIRSVGQSNAAESSCATCIAPTNQSRRRARLALVRLGSADARTQPGKASSVCGCRLCSSCASV